MTSAEYTSNRKFPSIFKPQINNISQKALSRNPSNFIPRTQNNIFNSSVSREIFSDFINSFCSSKSGKDNEIDGDPFIQAQFKNINQYSYEPTMGIQTCKMPNFYNGIGKTFKLETKQILFNDLEPNNGENKEENENMTLFEGKKSGKNIINSSSNNAIKAGKFFINHNFGAKCSCTKTKCKRKYCECFNSGNYCIDCDCKNCQNQKPTNVYTNKHPENTSEIKKSKEICTCLKSGCNKNYCECFKSGNKCSLLCRCFGCENNEENTQITNNKFQCCHVNRIYIIKNKIYFGRYCHKKRKVIKKNKIGKEINRKKKRLSFIKNITKLTIDIISNHNSFSLFLHFAKII